MTKRVHFIGRGGESIRFLIVDASVPNSVAFDMAEAWYEATGQMFDYIGLEISL